MFITRPLVYAGSEVDKIMRHGIKEGRVGTCDSKRIFYRSEMAVYGELPEGRGFSTKHFHRASILARLYHRPSRSSQSCSADKEQHRCCSILRPIEIPSSHISVYTLAIYKIKDLCSRQSVLDATISVKPGV